jgi:proline iminopeptidase
MRLSLTAILAAFVFMAGGVKAGGRQANSARPLIQQEGYVYAGDVAIYIKSIGSGPPMVVLHGGPGGSHDAFLPYLVPLAARHRLIFIDERGSGRSSRPEAEESYTLETMTQDIETVRNTLRLGQIDILGHSFGGILAQAYAIAHPREVRHLILASTWSSAERIDIDFAKIRDAADPQLKLQLEQLEAEGIFDSSGAQLPAYRRIANAVEGPYLYSRHRPTWDEPSMGIGWRVLKVMWCGRSDFHVDGNLTGFDFTKALRSLNVPTLVLVGDHDLTQLETATRSHRAIAKSQLVTIADSGHMSFVDRPDQFISAVTTFLH